MFGERDVLVKREQYRDRLRDAEHERLVRAARTGNARSDRFPFMEVLKQGVRLCRRTRSITVGSTVRGVRFVTRRYRA